MSFGNSTIPHPRPWLRRLPDWVEAQRNGTTGTNWPTKPEPQFAAPCVPFGKTRYHMLAGLGTE